MNFIKYTKIYLLISALLLVPGIYSLARYGLKLSIDFTGGTLLEIQTPASEDQIKASAKNTNLNFSSIQSSSENVYLIRSKPFTQEQVEALKTDLSKSTSQSVKELRFETVGPTVGQELAQKALLALIVSSCFIVGYIAWSFRHIPKPYSPIKFGLSAVIALIHDVFVVLGLFSLFGQFLGVEIDSLFVTALLTVIGFSVHDTIVVFDRVRENLPKMPKHNFADVVNYSLAETLVRSLNTSITVVLTLTGLLLFGGESIRWFTVALLIGIISGTYSSIFNAAPILVMWEKRTKNSTP